MLLYIRPSFTHFFQKYFKKFLRETTKNISKQTLINFQENLELHIQLNTYIIAAKHNNICLLSNMFNKHDAYKNLMLLRDFIKRNRYEIFDESGKIYSWQEFYNLFNIK